MYETGVLAAFVLWLYSNIMLLVVINSRFERNLNKIGQRVSWATLTTIPMESADLNRSVAAKILRLALIAGFGLVFVPFSWLYVLVWIGGFLYRKSKDAGAPQAIKEFRWKLRNLDMTFDQLVKELMKLDDSEGVSFEEYRARLVTDLKDRGVFQA